MRILMVCLGNICRSPLAEGILQDLVTKNGLDSQVDSAGTNGFHVGESPHPSSCKVASEKGIDISKQVARQFSVSDFDKYDKIYALAKDVITEMKTMSGNKYDAHKVQLLMDEVKPGSHLDVPDPWYGNEEGYYPVYDLIEEACVAIIRNHAKILQHD